MNQTIQNLKGFRDFLPTDARKRKWLQNIMIQVCESWGYEPLETPALEPLELFAGQIGEDEKMFFTFKDYGGRDVALRYDQTVPTCRVLGQNFDKLVFPFRRYQAQSAFRAEKPQKGRYREFTQFDIDIFGVASPLADAEVIAVTLDIYRKIGFKQAIALVNNRDLMKDIPYKAIASLDKLKKIGKEGVINDMVNKGINKNEALSYYEKVISIKPDETIKLIFDYLLKSGFDKNWFSFEPTLARSFSYSQGPIWEIVIPGYKAGSVGGGERYDSMIERISGRKIFGTGIAIGFDRTLESAEECGLIPDFSEQNNILVTVFSENLYNESILLSKSLRENGIPTELYPDPAVKLEKQLKYADKRKIPIVLILGPEEAEKNTMTVKNMKTGEQKTIGKDEVMEFLKNILPSS